MGMSHNVLEGYVVSYDTIHGNHQMLQQGAQHATLIHPQALYHHQEQLHHQTVPQEQQTLLLVSPNNGDSQQLMITNHDDVKNSLLMVTELLPTQNMVQVPSASQLIQVVPSDSIGLIDANVHNGIEMIQVQSNPVTLLQASNGLILSNNQVIFCVQPSEEMSYQIDASEAMSQGLVDSPLLELSDTSYASTLAAKSWHMDSDLANRALMALSQSPEGTAQRHANHFNCTAAPSTFN